MDQSAFDRVARLLAARIGRRHTVAAGTAALAGGTASAAGQGSGAHPGHSGPATICHATGSPSEPFEVIAVGEKARRRHARHGDFRHGECCAQADCPDGHACAFTRGDVETPSVCQPCSGLCNPPCPRPAHTSTFAGSCTDISETCTSDGNVLKADCRNREGNAHHTEIVVDTCVDYGYVISNCGGHLTCGYCCSNCPICPEPARGSSYRASCEDSTLTCTSTGSVLSAWCAQGGGRQTSIVVNSCWEQGYRISNCGGSLRCGNC